MITSIFNRVTSGNFYNLEKATNHNNQLVSAKVLAKDLPTIEADFINNNHCGCCLHFGMYLFKLIREQGHEAYISITMEENPVTHQKTDSHVSVCYKRYGEWFIADPVETVKTGNKNCYDIPLKIFRKEQGTIWLYDPYGEHGDKLFFEEFLRYPIKTIE